MDLSKFNFLNISLKKIRRFTNSVNKGTVKESEIKEIFEKVKSKKYTKKEVTYLVRNIIFAAFIIPKFRIDYHIYSNEALLYVLSFVDIKGSANLKILYSLFPYIIITKKDKNNNKIYSFNTSVPRELKIDYYDRLYRKYIALKCVPNILIVIEMCPKYINFYFK
ncbi:hypothetical protein PIROE2DRAFT_5458 [Piromyces sp. E2]|nr:hypothetical protein PIROE2DRAFT_5458 [Piromyces sp. E2]|eukprot:OUM67190.1 hypothetical protein PIROE2DRAFT_5458 [Piromyces sp. E2]